MEAGGSFVKLAFPTAYDAAAWLTTQLDAINGRTGNRLWPDATRLPSFTPPTALQTRWAAAGVDGSAGLGKVSFNGELKAKIETTRAQAVENGRPVTYEVRVDHRIGQATFKLPFGKGQASVSYTYDWNDTHGSPIYYANGVFVDHTVEIEIPVYEVEKIFKQTKGAPNEAVQDLLLKVFGKVESVAPGSALKNLNCKVFSAVTDQLYAEAGKKNRYHRGSNITLKVAWSEYGEADGTKNLMCTRFYVGGEQVAGLDVNVKAVQVDVDFTASKSELVYESIGTKTVSYVQRQFIYSRPDRRWEDFKRANEDQLRELVRNIATDTSSPYYNQQVADAWKQGGYEAGMAALEAYWRERDRELGRVRSVATALASASERTQWPWAKDDLQREIAGLLEGLTDPADRRYAWELIDEYGGSYERIFDLVDDGSTHGRRLSRAVESVLTPAEKAGVKLAELADTSTWSLWSSVRSSRTQALQNQVAAVLEPLTPSERQQALDFVETIGGDRDRIGSLTREEWGSASQRRLAKAVRGLTL